jgi:hypothetical protein
MEINHTATVNTCDYNTGFENRSSGLAYPGGCPKDREKFYLAGYRTARKLNIITQQIQLDLRQIETINDESQKQREAIEPGSDRVGLFKPKFDYSKQEERTAFLAYAVSVLPLQILYDSVSAKARLEDFNNQEVARTERRKSLAMELDSLYRKQTAIHDFDAKMRKDPSRIESYLMVYHQNKEADPIDIDKPLAPYLDSLAARHPSRHQEFSFPDSDDRNAYSLAYVEVPHLKYDYRPVWASALVGFGLGHAYIGQEDYRRTGWIYSVVDAVLVGLIAKLNSGPAIGGLMISHLCQLIHVSGQSNFSNGHSSEILTENFITMPLYSSKF